MNKVKLWIINLFKNLDKIDLKIIQIGIKFCLFILAISVIFLILYLLKHVLFFYKLGVEILKLSMYLSIEFIICGIVADLIKKQTF